MSPARLTTLFLLLLLLVLQGQLWFGRGNVAQVAQLRQELSLQIQANEQARQNNEQLVSEVRDLREGLAMVEDMARYELGMVKPNEIFVQLAQPAP